MAQIKALFFDLEGTLVTKEFSDYIWNRKIPELYSMKKGISVNEAVRIVSEMYNSVGPLKIEWYDINYWFKRFGLENPSDILKQASGLIRVYDDVKPTLEKLYNRIELYIITNSSRIFLDFELSEISAYFNRVFSVTSDFKLTKANPKAFTRVLNILGFRGSEVIHVGDDILHDYISPRKAGLNCVLISREKFRGVKGEVKSLSEIYTFLDIF